MRKYLLTIVVGISAITQVWGQFSLLSSIPKRNASSVSINQSIILEFNEDVNPLTVADGLSIQSNLRGKLAFSVSIINNSITLTHSIPFIYSEEISITLLPVIESLTHVPLAISLTVRFMVETRPSIANPPNFLGKDLLKLGVDLISAADMDGDKDVDIVFLGLAFGWLENDGTGNFLRHDITVINDFPQEIKPFDIDQDGDMDLIITVAHAGIMIFTNDGSQNFNISATISGNSISRIDVVDFDSNGQFDIVYSGREFVNDNYELGSYILYNQGAGIFNKTKINSLFNYNLKCADLDSDGDWDIIQSNDTSLTYLLNTGTSFISNTIFSDNAVTIEGFVVADFNNDHNMDIVMTKAGFSGSSIQIWLNNGALQFMSNEIDAAYNLHYSSMGDFDGDRDLDLIIFSEYKYTMLENSGTANFVRKEVTLDLNEVFSPLNSVSADFDGDGDLDLATLPSNHLIKYYKNSIFPFASDALVGIKVMTEGDSDWGDFDNDGDLDLLLSGIYQDTIVSTVLYKNQNGKFIEMYTPLPGVYKGSCDWGDYDNDGDLDILIMGATKMDLENYDPIFSIYTNNNEEFTILSSSETQLPKTWSGKARWGDFDNDGWLDIVFNTLGASGIYKSDGKGNFSNRYSLPTFFTDGRLDFADFDMDGDLDIAVSGGEGSGYLQSALKVFRNDGYWKFSETGDFIGRIGGNLNWADMDNDGDLDLVVSGDIRSNDYNFTGPITVYENQGTLFKAIIGNDFYLADSYGTTSTGDFNNDGSPDVIASTRGSSSYSPSLTLLENDGHGELKVYNFELPKIAARVVNWIDYDQDHDLDIFVGADLIRNNSDNKNTPPVPPTLIQADSVFNNSIYLHWDAGNDSETDPSGLSYQIYMGEQSKNQSIVNSNSNIETGLRKIAELGAAKGKRTIVTDLFGGVYHFGVQSIDASFEGSPFSDEGQVYVIGIHGNSGACQGYNYSYVAKPSGNYTWQVEGGTIVSGQGTDSLIVSWNTLGQGYVKISNSQGNRNTLVVHIDKKPQPVIFGDSTVCTDLQSYNVTDDLSYSTSWTVAGSNLIQEQSGNQVVVNWSESGQHNLIVKSFPEYKGCFSYDTVKVKVDRRPTLSIAGPALTCTNQVDEYLIESNSPNWQIINGNIISESLEKISVKWSANPSDGAIFLEEKSANQYCTSYDSLLVTIRMSPPKPTLTLFQDTIILSSPSPTGYYQWYYNGIPEINGFYRGIIPYVAGSFVVEVFNFENCGSKSDPFVFITSVKEPDYKPIEGQFVIYPNPADQRIIFELTDLYIGECEIEIYSSTGILSRKFDLNKNDQTIIKELNISDLNTGMYIIRISTKDNVYMTKFLRR